ncbi:MAG: hypothetical protein U0524_01720 [Candidatus Saccharimonadales bacterium]
MEPRGDQPQRSDSQSTPLERPNSFDVPVHRRPPLSRGSAPQPMARRPAVPTVDNPQQPTASAPPPEPIVHPEPLAAQPVAANEPEPVIQMPQPEALAPPQQSIETPGAQSDQTQSNIEQPSAAQQNPLAPTSPLARQLDFTPPPKQKNFRRWIKPALAVGVVAILGIGIFSYTKVLAARNNPDTVMRDAIANSLSITTVQGTTKYPGTTITTQFDFTDARNPVINAANSVTSPKGQSMINGYGNLKNTYINYASLPKSVAPKIAKQMSTTWIQVREDGELPKTVPEYVFKATDPRYQAFGPIIMGNFEGKTKEQLVDFILKNKVYGYEAEKTKKEALGDETMFVFPIKLDVSYLKVASQSAAVSMGLEPTDTQVAVDAMDSLRGASVTLYIRASDHTIARMYISKDGVAKTIDLTAYTEAKVPSPPQTKLLWQGFTPLQNQIEAQADLTKTQY